jgi:hypothetical protein
MPVIHLYLKGKDENESETISTSRVTVFCSKEAIEGSFLKQHAVEFMTPALVLGTLPQLTFYPLSEVDWFWVEAD